VKTIVRRCAALDVHKDSISATARTPRRGGGREQHQAEFGTTAAQLLALRDWLAAHKLTQVAMEATGIYWRPVWAVLEEEFDLLLVNARHVKQVPGRKTDLSDSAWLCQLLEAGLLRASFVPPRPIRELRNLTRYRKAQIAERQREANRLHKMLQDAGIKLDSVATDVLGVSGRAMLAALCQGTTDPDLLAELARGQLRRKIPALREALAGRFRTDHALVVSHILAHLEFLDETVASLSAAIEQALASFEPELELLQSIPGVGRRTAEVIIAECGADMTQFPTAGHLVSWAGLCPGHDQSAGKHRSGRTRKGSKWLRTALVEAAAAATRTNATYLSAQYRRLKARRGHGRAVVAVAHSILASIWQMLSAGLPYRELGPDYYQRRDPKAAVRRLVRQLEALGQHVTLQPLAA
jgi:transposase